MGIEIPPIIVVPPVPVGLACPICWGAGKPFGIAGTPESLTVSFSGINKGPNWLAGDGEPLNGVVVVEQGLFLGCSYDYITLDAQWNVNYGVVGTLVFITATGGIHHFTAHPLTDCLLEVANEENDKFTGGTAVISIPGIE